MVVPERRIPCIKTFMYHASKMCVLGLNYNVILNQTFAIVRCRHKYIYIVLFMSR
ncbi:hypothetical protein KsCSTR_31400 [Candidatus Kuenenia stuttgartiensis]|uniref:Uncharacterized protein n=1 Tax=Kuenenia stuttgartiensis TaxID=174633 RepID=A0A6G7GSG2_KUEST|nr:hypothetical protein KsCSTR_31400 [Candidatus Kuenenia stuttgartiensis]